MELTKKEKDELIVFLRGNLDSLKESVREQRQFLNDCAADARRLSSPVHKAKVQWAVTTLTGSAVCVAGSAIALYLFRAKCDLMAATYPEQTYDLLAQAHGLFGVVVVTSLLLGGYAAYVVYRTLFDAARCAYVLSDEAHKSVSTRIDLHIQLVDALEALP